MKKYWWKYDNTREYNSREGASSRAKGWTSPVCGSMNKKNKEDAPQSHIYPNLPPATHSYHDILWSVFIFIIILRFLRWQSLGLGARLLARRTRRTFDSETFASPRWQHLALTVCNIWCFSCLQLHTRVGKIMVLRPWLSIHEIASFHVLFIYYVL